MKNIDSVLNSIYCTSQCASKTMVSLRAYPSIAKNSNHYRLYFVIEELHIYTLEVFKAFKLDFPGELLKYSLDRLFEKGFYMEEVFGDFINTVPLSDDNMLIRQLKLQIENLLLQLSKLALHVNRVLGDNKSAV